jgi:hypothetical protein
MIQLSSWILESKKIKLLTDGGIAKETSLYSLCSCRRRSSRWPWSWPCAVCIANCARPACASVLSSGSALRGNSQRTQRRCGSRHELCVSWRIGLLLRTRLAALVYTQKAAEQQQPEQPKRTRPDPESRSIDRIRPSTQHVVGGAGNHEAQLYLRSFLYGFHVQLLFLRPLGVL